jgi:hypothetical protein
VTESETIHTPFAALTLAEISITIITENVDFGVIILTCVRFGYYEKGTMEDDFVCKLGGKVT